MNTDESKIWNQRCIDLISILVLISVSAVLTLSFKINPVVSWLLYYIPPSIFLFLRERKNFLKVFSASFIIGIILGTAIDLIASYNNIWSLDIRLLPELLGILPFDNIVWWFFSMFFVFTFYEHFVKNKSQNSAYWKPNRKLTLFCIVVLSILAFVIVGITNDLWFLQLDYFYFKMGLVLVSPLILVLITHPKALAQFFLWTVPFFFINLGIEVIGVHLGHWSFPDDYVGIIALFNTSFPFEELLFWMILSTPVMFAWYAGFVDKNQSLLQEH